jgi:spore coat protein U-like protein
MQAVIIGILSSLCISDAFAASATANIAVSYAVPRVCSFSNLPATINLNAQGGQAFTYSTSFNITCNTNSNINLSLASQNKTGTQMRLRSNTGNKFILYSAAVNGTNYPSNTAQSITPNATSYLLYLSFAAPDYANTFRDTLTFTLTY